MNNKINFTKAAKLIAKSGKIDKKTADTLINNLSRKNLAVFARIVERISNQSSVRVISESPLPSDMKNTIISKFIDKKVIFEQGEIGAGIQLIINDTIIDLTVAGFLDNTIKKLKLQN